MSVVTSKTEGLCNKGVTMRKRNDDYKNTTMMYRNKDEKSESGDDVQATEGRPRILNLPHLFSLISRRTA